MTVAIAGHRRRGGCSKPYPREATIMEVAIRYHSLSIFVWKRCTLLDFFQFVDAMLFGLATFFCVSLFLGLSIVQALVSETFFHELKYAPIAVLTFLQMLASGHTCANVQSLNREKIRLVACWHINSCDGVKIGSCTRNILPVNLIRGIVPACPYTY